MAVLKMKRIGIYALKKNRKAVLETLQRRGVLEVAIPKEASEIFEKLDTVSARQAFEKSAQTLRDAASILDTVSPQKKGLLASFSGRPVISDGDYEKTVDDAAELSREASRIVSLDKERTEASADILRLTAQIDALKPWEDFDISLRSIGSEHTSVFIGSFPEELTAGEITEKIAKDLPQVPAVQVEVVSTRPQQTCAFLLCHARYGMQLEGELRAMGFSYPASPPRSSPRERIAELRENIEKLQDSIERNTKSLEELAKDRDRLLYASDYYSMRADKYEVLGELWQSPHAFAVTGYIPKEDAAALERELTGKFGAYVEFSDPGEDEDVPVKLKNGFFSSPVEGVVEGYSLPGRDECDPSTVMSVFYYLLFGLMLSDAAYGLILVIGCALILWKFKNMEQGMRKMLTMFMFCGVSTTFWGVMFGSYFGDAIPVIARTFFNKEITIPALWFVPLNDPMRLLLFSFLLGIIHLFTGLGVQFYLLVKRRKFADALYDVVFWYFLVGGLILLLLSTSMFRDMMNLSFTLPSWVGKVSAVFAGIGAVGIVATSGRESKNPAKRLLKGLYGLYNVSGYLSDILSYSRLLALGLATGVIAQVFNQLGSMLGGGVLGAIFFTVVFIIGHVMNLAINVLGAYVHTNRLQYVEFFGKFYTGGGRKFNPFSANTKYFKFTEENQNG